MVSFWPTDLGGINAPSTKGSGWLFSSLPSFVNAKLKPGHTSQKDVARFSSVVISVTSLKYFFFSPNLTWCLMALAYYYVCPYDISLFSGKSCSSSTNISFFLSRLRSNFLVAFCYYGYFYIGLYVLKQSKRKYNPGSYPTLGNMLHNLYYWTLGVLQWTFWELVMVKIWASGKVGYVSFEALLADKYLLAMNVAIVLVVPIWRDLHFYVAHRFLHIRPLYKHVHSLHHRNTDPEPFSGMCMHPIEHLYYFSNAFTPALYVNNLSPFVFCWIFFHLTIAPACGHSGWEDHFQSDQYHHIHHAKFESNYGSPNSAFLDQLFGTFRESLGKSTEYKGEWEAEVDDDGSQQSNKSNKKVWSSDGYLGVPKNVIFTAFWVILFVVVTVEVMDLNFPFLRGFLATRAGGEGGDGVPSYLALWTAVCPIIIATFLTAISGDKLPIVWPFHKEKGGLIFTLVGATLACVVPVYHAVSWGLKG